MHIQNISIKNFKSIEDLKFKLEGRSLFVVGDNGVGKSTFIQALFCLLTGKNIPKEPVTTGHTKSELSAEFGNYRVELNMTNSRNEFKLYQDGEPVSSPRKTLESVIQFNDFDPFEFLRMTGKKQVEFVKEMVGIDFTELESDYNEVFEDRKNINRDIKNLQGKINESTITEVELKVFKEEKPVHELKEEIKGIDTFNETRIKNGQAIEEFIKGLNVVIESIGLPENNIELAQNQLQSVRRIYNRLHDVSNSEDWDCQSGKSTVMWMDQVLNSLKEQISELQGIVNDPATKEKYEQLVFKKQELQERIENGKKWLADNPVKKSGELNARLEELNRFNLKVAEANGVRNDMAALDELRSTSDKRTERLREIENEKMDIIAKANIPIPGLSFTDEYLTYNGLPFNEDQLPKSTIIKVGLDIAMFKNPIMKVCRIKDGALLGSVMDEVLEIAKEQDYQMFIEVVDRDEKSLKLEIIEDIHQ